MLFVDSFMESLRAFGRGVSQGHIPESSQRGISCAMDLMEISREVLGMDPGSVLMLLTHCPFHLFSHCFLLSLINSAFIHAQNKEKCDRTTSFILLKHKESQAYLFSLTTVVHLPSQGSGSVLTLSVFGAHVPI